MDEEEVVVFPGRQVDSNGKFQSSGQRSPWSNAVLKVAKVWQAYLVWTSDTILTLTLKLLSTVKWTVTS